MEAKNPGFLGACSPCSPCCENKDRMTVKVQADQPVVSVPVYQDVLRRDKFVEVPQVSLHDTLIPKLYTQETVHEVPNAGISYSERPIEVESVKYVEKQTPISVPMGYSPKFVPTWDIKQVPKPVPKYYGEQKIIEVDVPKITEVEKPVEVVKYEWKEQFQDVPVYKYVPKFDVELECPPPLIVPYPEQTVVKVPPIEEGSALNCYSLCKNLGLDCCAPNSNYASEYSAEEIFKLRTSAANQMNAQEFNSQIDYSQYGVQEGMPLYPLPSPQMDPNFENMPESDISPKNEIKKSESWFCWPFCKQSPVEKCKSEEEPPFPDYPKNMPTDFANYFRAKDSQKTQSENSPTVPEVASELEPTVEYKGSVKKSSVFGGTLDPITFKLHAVEVHQFISLPDIAAPPFVQTLPEIDISLKRTELESFFGPIPEGWADPGITGMPAPIMYDILKGNYQKNKSVMPTEEDQHFDDTIPLSVE